MAPSTSHAAAVEAPRARKRTRVVLGMRQPQNWLQLARFLAVGGSGYVVNLMAFALASAMLGLHHLTAATVAFLVAVTNNFVLNRRWTFAGAPGRRRRQATRFLVVSVAAFLFGAAVLELLVGTGLQPIVAQAASIVCATPLSFLGNKLWSFDG